jgi:hypothetical protein
MCRNGRLFWHYPKTPTGCAIHLDILDLWIRALERAKWIKEDVESLLDEELYVGVPQLLSGIMNYISCHDCRREFVQKLILGEFVKENDLFTIGNWTLDMLVWNLGLKHDSSYSILPSIVQVNSAYEKKSMPGSWHGDEELRLVPGVDFDLPKLDRHLNDIDWHQYIECPDSGEEGNWDRDMVHRSTKGWRNAGICSGFIGT